MTLVFERLRRHGHPRVVGEHPDEPAAERGAGALEGTGYRDLAGLQHLGCLGRRVAEHVAQHQDGALPGWHMMRTAELERILDRGCCEDFAVENGSRTVREVALEVLTRAGWPH